ncbi:hypothetical protein [Aquimarina aquimarini]|uniref:hypothetical protein n=1 Tax=Aquimarina aquimarini TaxID=1191734 RepID=UPI000D559FFF|nr:hypothetical protein [Aquimarina aquimarini]
MKEGITVLPEHNDILLLIVEKYNKNKPFVYITQRINSYTVNPTVYLEISKTPSLAELAVASNNPKQKVQTKLEKAFLKKNFDCLKL